MVAAKLTYEECRRKRLEENNKRLKALNLPLLSQALRESLTPKSSPAKNSKPRRVREQQVPLRRSSRVANKAYQAQKEISEPVVIPAVVTPKVVIPRVVVSERIHSKGRDLSNRVYASEEARTCAMERAEELQASLEPQYPSFLKSMLQSHVTGGFWLGLPVHFCKATLPKSDVIMNLVDEEGDEYPTVFLARKSGLSGGWKRFSVAHKLVDGDALVFQLIRPTKFKVIIELYCRLSTFIIPTMEYF
ncbi:hypothetical protein PVL29_023787 [Vitis rotundifolia]|uniref:TF-B3 domain-containing protein n=1 Tax=Vitis rotundifolia TaxID=103349 RepID=A0AA38YPU6_VITRO|nr:hypothetical protein PVL29_023787 [Vitis rotundifolia]